jgi:transcriptional regulator with GAF, ATPase, and Fis domain
LDIEERSHKVINKKEIANYVVVSAISVSRAEMGLLYKFNDENKPDLIAGKGLDEKEIGVFQNICPTRKTLRVNGPFESFKNAYPEVGNKFTYFVALPIKKEKKCIGLLFLAFADRKSMDTQELEFLDVFSVHASNALVKAGVLK